MKKILIVFLLTSCVFTSTVVHAQDNQKPIIYPEIGIKTNVLYDVTSTINLGLEFKTGDKYTLDISANYNPWTFGNNKKLKHILIQPEFRYWTDNVFNKHFFGIHGIYGHYNVGNIKLPIIGKQKLENTRYQGDMYGVGFSYGYQWNLSPKWNIEAAIGLGYLHLDYKAYDCGTCGKELYKKNNNYLGPTKAALSLIYMVK